MAEKNPFYGATFAERKAIREAAEKAGGRLVAKAVDAEDSEAEDKAVAPKKAATKRTAKKA